jgi:hypothetical protein
MTAPTSDQVSPRTIRQLLDRMRRQPLALLAGCGCALPVAAVSLRDFEEAVVFHIQTRWSLATGGPDEADLGGLIDAIDRLPEADHRRQRILRELHESLRSYAQACTVHRFRAELTG